MIFVYKKWDTFCKGLWQKGIISIPANNVDVSQTSFLVLKHDVETKVGKAYKLAKIEHKYGHKGSYYVQAYLINNPKNIKLLKKIQEMGHEVSYHYDVMDSNKGDLDKAVTEFENNRSKFEEIGFSILTVCQHGNPVIERIGYSSNRDFFRSNRVQNLYPNVSDIMVDFATKKNITYTYYSDAGRNFKMIYDPLTNDIFDSESKNIPYNSLSEILPLMDREKGNIISTHPHRWTSLRTVYLLQLGLFNLVKSCVKIAMRVPFAKKIIEKHYDLAKKF